MLMSPTDAVVLAAPGSWLRPPRRPTPLTTRKPKRYVGSHATLHLPLLAIFHLSSIAGPCCTLCACAHGMHLQRPVQEQSELARRRCFACRTTCTCADLNPPCPFYRPLCALAPPKQPAQARMIFPGLISTQAGNDMTRADTSR